MLLSASDIRMCVCYIVLLHICRIYAVATQYSIYVISKEYGIYATLLTKKSGKDIYAFYNSAMLYELT